MTPASSVTLCCVRWVSKLMTVKRLISSNASRRRETRIKQSRTVDVSPLFPIFLPPPLTPGNLPRPTMQGKTLPMLFCLLQSTSFRSLHILLRWSCAHRIVPAEVEGGISNANTNASSALRHEGRRATVIGKQPPPACGKVKTFINKTFLYERL